MASVVSTSAGFETVTYVTVSSDPDQSGRCKRAILPRYIRAHVGSRAAASSGRGGRLHIHVRVDEGVTSDAISLARWQPVRGGTVVRRGRRVRVRLPEPEG